MRGKILFIAGGLTGYVLGTRAGRERYEQIKKQWLKVWNAAPVQKQVGKVEDFAKARVSEVPAALWTGVKGVAKVVSQQGTPGQKLDSAIAKAKDAAEDLEEAVDVAVSDAKKPVKPARKTSQASGTSQASRTSKTSKTEL